MSSGSPLLDRLVQSLRCLPGVGAKSAQRMALHLLERDRDGARLLSETLLQAVERIGRCEQCRNLSEHALCALCANERREAGVICVVSSPADVHSLERAGEYRGRYFVLMGQLSPLDGIGPEELGLDVLAARLDQGEVGEIILATGTTVEGEATAHYIGEMARARGIRATRIAYGVPLGGDLEYVDSGTLSLALASRREV